MKRKRKGLRPSQRFEVFRRDGFRCRYCGATPVDRPLHVDHVIPVSDGGTDDDANLVTACAECNGGKGARRLDHEGPPSPSVDELRDQIEQIRAFLVVQQDLAQARSSVERHYADMWEEQIGPMSEDMASRLRLIVRRERPEHITEAIAITAQRLGAPNAEYHWDRALRQQKYFSGVLRRLREEARE